MFQRINKIEMLDNGTDDSELELKINSPKTNNSETNNQEDIDNFVPQAQKVDFIEKGSIVVRVMDEHNFYEAECMSEEYLKESSIGLLTKIWISISKSLKE